MTENNYQSPIDKLEGKVADVSNEVKWALACYIPAFNIVFCLLASVRMVNSDFCLFHMRQGLVIFGFWFLSFFVSIISRGIGLMLWGIVLMAYIAGIVMVLKKSTAPLPIIGSLAENIPKYYLFERLTGKKSDTIMNQSEHGSTGASGVTPATPTENANPPAEDQNK